MSNGLRLTGKALDALLKNASPKQIESLREQGVTIPGDEPGTPSKASPGKAKRARRKRKHKEECPEYDYVSGPITADNPLEGHPLRREQLTVTVHEPEPLAIPWESWACEGINALTVIVCAIATVGGAVVHAAYRVTIIVFGYGVFRK